jgi:hypothetical protein
MTRLQGQSIRDFTGGLNIRENSFQLADNESPAMLNVFVDPRGGFFTREGWVRWNDDNIAGPWDPRNAMLHQYSDGTFAVYLTNDGKVWRANSAGEFVDAAIPCSASPHLADFAAWSNKVYIACGQTKASYWHDNATKQPLAIAGSGNWNDNYTTPVGGVYPSAELTEAHGGYTFCGDVFENFSGGGALRYPNRIRWSHPNAPEDWAQQDYIDIQQGGGRITALQSFTDHLMIFKDASVWALYGYDSESWQLVEVSRKSGTVSPTTVTTSEDSCYYYSPAGRSAVFVIQGGARPESISEPIRLVMSQSVKVENVWLSWVSNRLFVNMPWVPERIVPATFQARGASQRDTTTFVFDLFVKEGGAWEALKPARGGLRSMFELPASKVPFGVLAAAGTDHCVVQLGANTQDATDKLNPARDPEPFVAYYTTNWKDGGTEELRKHWLRPRFVVRNPQQDMQWLVRGYRNYDNTNQYRSWTMGITAGGQPFWRQNGASDPDGFDWAPTDVPVNGNGTVNPPYANWAAQQDGSRIIRGQALGIARSIRLVFTPTPAYAGRGWGIDSMVLKHVDRRFTT